MLRSRLKEMDLRITELADYLQVSRPTMYKFIEYYEQDEFDLINKKVLKLFNYIKENDLVGKKAVINYILSNLVDLKSLGSKEENNSLGIIKKYLVENPDSKKSKFIELIATKDVFDKLIYYLLDINTIVGKKKLTEEEKEKLSPYLDILKRI